MKRLSPLLFAVVALGATGCTLKSAQIPSAHIPFAKADYTVLGATNAEECGTYILGIDFAHLFVDQSASSGGDALLSVLGLGSSKEESRALYAALERMPEATHLLEPRVLTSKTGIPSPVGGLLFGTQCATVVARGVRIGDRPLPGQQQ